MRSASKTVGAVAAAVVGAAVFSVPDAAGQLLAQFPDAASTVLSVRDDGTWLYIPAIVNGSVVGFLAACDPAVLGRNSFAVVWFGRTGTTQFVMQGWHEISIEDAAAAVVDQYGEPAMFEFGDMQSPANWFGASPTTVIPTPAVITAHGIAIDDPWQEVAGTLTAEDIAYLVDQGYAVGARGLSGDGEMAGGCVDEVSVQAGKLAGFAVLVEEQLFGVVSAGSALPSSLQACCIAPQWCVYSYSWGPWSDPESIGSAAPACRWTRSGTASRTCGTCWWSWTRTWPVTDNRTCPTPVAGQCPASPTCAGAYP